MLHITFSDDIPDTTYFRTSDAEPRLNNDTLIVLDGQGSRRSWGRPGVTSTVVLNEDDICAVHVGFYHKHGGSQFWRYYVPDGDKWRQAEWRELDDTMRLRILEAAEKKAPHWAKSPGKLRSQRRKPTIHRTTTWKVVRVEEGRMLSVYDGETEYRLGKTMRQKAEPAHGGGYYSYTRPPEELEEAFREGDVVGTPPPGRYAVLECEIWGRKIEYGDYKVASTYLRPVKVISTFTIDD